MILLFLHAFIAEISAAPFLNLFLSYRPKSKAALELSAELSSTACMHENGSDLASYGLFPIVHACTKSLICMHM